MLSHKNGAHELAVDCIYTALLQLMSTKNYKDITITDITKRAGVSRMAYYRNYKDKDEILIRHLKVRLKYFEETLPQNVMIAEEELWENFFAAFIGEPIIINIVRAGLSSQLLEVHIDFTTQVYEKLFHWNIHDENVLMTVYQRTGSVIGLMVYSIYCNQNASKKEMAQKIVTCS